MEASNCGTMYPGYDIQSGMNSIATRTHNTNNTSGNPEYW